MPGLGDALSKAFEDSTNDLDALLQKAAGEETDSSEETGELPQADGGGRSGRAAEPVRAGVGGTEKTSLLSLDDLDVAPVDAGPPPDEEAGSVAGDSAAVTMAEADLDALLKETGMPPASPASGSPSVSASDATKRLARNSEGESRGADGSAEAAGLSSAPAAEPADALPVGQAAVAAATSAPVPSGSPASPPPPPPPPPPAPTPAPMAVPVAAEAKSVAPFAHCAASGVIRRKLKSGKTGGEEPAPAPPPPRVTVPAVGDVLKECREIGSLPKAANLKIPSLADALSGLIRLTGSPGGPHMLAVCGAAPRSGASTAAAAAALRLATDAKLRVLLAEANFRAPSLGAMIEGDDRGPGLRAVLEGEVALADALVFSRQENLALLPATARRQDCRDELPRLAELLAGGKVDGLLGQLHAQFDYVIFDAGALAEWGGPEKLAAAVGAAVLTVRAGRTTRHVAAAARQSLARAGARLVGALLTFA
jgi:Mrp family chromosome partitioning ATPase